MDSNDRAFPHKAILAKARIELPRRALFFAQRLNLSHHAKPTRQVGGKQSRLADFSVSLSWNRRPALPNKYSRLLGIRCDVRRTAPDDFQYSHDLVLLTIAQDDYLQTH